MSDLLNFSNPAPRTRTWRVVFLLVAAVALSALIIFGSMWGYQEYYRGHVYPGVTLGEYELGGLSAEELKNVIENSSNRYSKEGIQLRTVDKNGNPQGALFSTVLASENAVEIMKLDSDALVQLALYQGRDGSVWSNLWRPWVFRLVRPVALTAPVAVNGSLASEALRTTLKPWEDPAADAALEFRGSAPVVVAEKSGYNFDYEQIIADMTSAMAHLSFAPVHANLVRTSPTVTASEVEELLPSYWDVMAYGSVGISHIDSATKARKDWTLTADQLPKYLALERDTTGQLIFGLDQEKIIKYLELNVVPEVDSEPAEAKFNVKNTKVEEFQASKNGLKVDLSETYLQLATVFRARNYRPSEVMRTVNVAVKIVEPTVKTADVNNLGITEIVGVGTSTFKDSHTNRIKNIAHAVERLNGYLIKPGEEFSATKAAGPFTAENGFLPEQVIKGNEIKPEIGGGMCQIGTTLFRMAMNTGLPITERHNHSLVVSYYADPVNGNPGTDATLYEPILDFKFNNDTGNYLLLETHIDYQKQLLTFTLWGKPDGRKGGYTHPLVKRWIPAGEPQDILVDDGTLQPGEKKCQNAFRGAVASFTYTRYTPAGEKIERVFDSYYRPLPKICRVGIEKGGVCKPGEVCTPTSTPAIAE